MAAAVNKEGGTQQPNPKKTQKKEAKQKVQAKQTKGARSEQATKQVKKPMEKKKSCKAKECRSAKKFLRSYLERFCKSVCQEAERLMKENGEPQISDEVLQTALEHYMSKEKWHSVIPAIKKAKMDESSEEGAERASSPSEKQDAPNQEMPKECQ